MYKSVVFTIVSCLLIPSLCRAQNNMQTALDAFAKTFSGTWASESTLDRDSEGLGKKGDTLVAHITFQKQDGLIVVDWKGEVNGKPAGTSAKGLLGWDAAQKKLRLNWFATAGSSGTIVYTQRAHGWDRQSTSILPDGSESSSRVLMKFTDKDAYVDMATERKEGDESLPPREVVWKRSR